MGITRQQAYDCFSSDDLIGIGMEADAVRRRIHPGGVVSYTIDRALDCTLAKDDLLYDDVCKSTKLGATGLLVQDREHQRVPIDRFESIFAGIKQRFPSLHLHGLSATRILSLASVAQISLRDALTRLRDAGLDSIDSYAVILNDEIRQRVAPGKCSTADWIDVHRTAHKLGLRSTATMVFGAGETVDQRIDHLELLRSLQQETGGFTSFTPLPYQGGAPIDESTAVEYLKTLSTSRLYLDSIENLQGSWATQGLKVLQMGLRCGSNDVGSVYLDDRFGKPGGATEEELRRVIREAGFKPAQRDLLYRTMFLN